MKYLISRQIGGSYTVVEAKEYVLPYYQTKTYNRGRNLFNEDLGQSEIKLTHKKLAYVEGDAFSSSMTYEQCLEFCKTHNLELLTIPLHTSHVTLLDSRTFDSRFIK